ncbi:uncharacterized [Tachysurus ichikawai]
MKLTSACEELSKLADAAAGEAACMRQEFKAVKLTGSLAQKLLNAGMRSRTCCQLHYLWAAGRGSLCIVSSSKHQEYAA